MIVFVCLDVDGGMMFQNRRQTSDQEVIRDMCRLCACGKIRMNHYSAQLFQDFRERITADENFLEEAGEGEYCFVENQALLPYEARIEKLILYQWNRKYPKSISFDLDLERWILESSQQFSGHSHEVITRETYVREMDHAAK